ncbi:MFS transporter [Streptomyces sp. CMB-StM0423]|uniref:MFS transporter n=1 Tax=Streptomyces sp. CMB-StM0423 TaxID=2059884 RepID=UPI000C71325A|nr:MFS transporter [Streptomyces sp. CMB-StM0423]AUH43038.1 MFS transporter [Streptomyces sp. CMB-StM0423]
MPDTTTTSPAGGSAPGAAAVSSKARGTDNAPGTRTGWLLGIVLAGQFMALLDVFIVNVAAPTMRTDLGTSGAELQLIIAGYVISYSVLLITGARLGAMLGHRRMYLGGLVLFTAASLACGLAATSGQLIAFRLVQGAGAAAMIPQVLSLIQRNFTGTERVRALGVYAAVLATGAAAGQIAGGLLVSADIFGWSWRPVFLVNVVVGLPLLVLGARLLPRDEPRSAAGGAPYGGVLDRGGLVLLAAAVTLFTVPLVLGQELDWPVWGWIMLGGSVAAVAAFAAYESGLARRGGVPLFPPRVVRAPGMPVAVVRAGLAMVLNGAFMFVMALHLQSGLGFGPLRAGLTFVPTAVAFGIAGLTWQRLPERLRPAVVPAGFVTLTVSFVAVGLAMRDGGEGGPGFYAGLTGVGLGLALAFSPNLTAALALVRTEDAPHVSGLLTTTAQLGGLIGVATIGTLYLERVGALTARSSADAVWDALLALAAVGVLGLLAGVRYRYRR